MDLQLLASEIANSENLYDRSEKSFNEILKIEEVETEEDIDALNKFLRLSTGDGMDLPDITIVNIDKIISHANVARPYLHYDKNEEYFV